MPAYRLSDTYSTPLVGLTFITSSTFSAASSVSVDGCFTATYTNYRVLLSYTPSTTGQAFSLRFRVASTDATTNYGEQFITGSGGTIGGSGTGALTQIRISATNGTTSPHSVNLDIFSPAVAAATGTINTSSRPDGTNAPLMETGIGYLSNTTAYDGFTVYPGAGTITGTVTIYGYRKA